ncbi:MAG: Fe-S cluster assembly protein SufB [bacterium]|nr:Fe-S cluster assembly protein SufB [bacterium]
MKTQTQAPIGEQTKDGGATAIPDRFLYRAKKGITREVVEEISTIKNEPAWMRELRLKSFEEFMRLPVPTWGPDLSGLHFDEITYYQRTEEGRYKSWDDVPADIKNTFEKIGVPQAERAFLAGVIGQYESEGFYQKLRPKWEDKGVIFCDTDTAVQKYPELVKEYFMTKCVKTSEHKLAALHGAVWSGGSFLYVPNGVHVDMPLQTYFRMNARASGQFEHTLIIVDEGASVQYIEGCTAPMYNTSSLHAAVVEIFVKKGARCRYTTIQNWSKDVYNLNTKRSIVEEDGIQEWVGGSMGSKTTMLYPCSILQGRGARAEHLNIAVAGPGQHKDTGAKVIHLAPQTSSTVISKSISFGGGISTYRGQLKIVKGAKGATSHVQCDALMPDNISVSNTVPYITVDEEDVTIGHEAKIGRISEEQVFYLMSRGLTEEEAINLVVQGFMEPVIKTLPLEYAVELNRLIQLEMEGSLG